MVTTEITVTLESPFPLVHLPLAWEWMHEHPERNLDDYYPREFDGFVAEMKMRHAVGELTWCVYKNAEPVGIIGYKPWSPRSGMFHGICFTERAWGRETTETAARAVLKQLFDSGVEKISAFYFRDNVKIHRFLADLGAKFEGLMTKQTMRDGELVDMLLVAIFKESYSSSPKDVD